MGRLLNSYGDIKNEGKVLCELKTKIAGFSNLSGLEVTNAINKSVKKTDKTRYFDFDYTELEESESGKTVMWLDTGYTDDTGETVYVQFTGGNPWTGAFVGTEKCILDYQREYRENVLASSKEKAQKLEKDLEVDLTKIDGVNVIFEDSDKSQSQQAPKKETTKEDKVPFLDVLYGELLIPNSWDKASLRNYINTCIIRINHCIRKGKSVEKYVKMNNNKTLAIIDSGLLDKFGNKIMLMAKTNGDGLGHEVRMCGGKAYMSNLGFDKAELNRVIERVQFSDNGITDLTFLGDMCDFDLDSRVRLEHCIEDRRARFPESYREVSPQVICSDIVRAVEIGVEISKYDRNYIKPIYNRNDDSISFVIPYHLSNNFQNKPELGIVIGQVAGYWQIMTVLGYNEVMIDIKLFNMYENETF